MISVRASGYAEETLDERESIPGYDARVDTARFRRVLDEVTCAIVGETSDRVSADGRLFATRDVTETVERIALITASILAKKLSAGLDGLIIDVRAAAAPSSPMLSGLQRSPAASAGCGKAPGSAVSSFDRHG